jgi:peptide/nickel transport system permease protein
VLAVKLPIFPATGYVPFAESPVRWFESLVLPVLTLGFGSCAPIAKQTRDGMLTELQRDYVTTLRARGVAERKIVLLHALRNAATPVLSVAGLVLIGLFGGAVLAETVFVLPGLGSLAVDAASTHNIPVVQGVAIAFTLLVLLVNLLVEIGYAALNPRVRA